MKRRVLVLGGIGLLGFACGTERLNAGSSVGADAGGSPDAGNVHARYWPDAPSNSFDVPCTLPPPPSLAGAWEGAFDTYALPSGSKSVRVEITGAFMQSDGLCGTVTFGSGEPLPVATDAETAPPGAPNLAEAALAGRLPREGFGYEFNAPGTLALDGAVLLAKPAVKGDQVRFGINLKQSFKAWCNLQPAYLDDFGAPLSSSLFGACLPPEAFDPGSDARPCEGLNLMVRHASCAQAAFCVTGLCTCGTANPGLSGLSASPSRAASGCTVPPTPSTMFALTLAGTALTGTVELPNTIETLRLTRLP